MSENIAESAERDDGGPAFPVLFKVGDVAKSEGGMSLRDWLAGQAIPQLQARRFELDNRGIELSDKAIAVEAYQIADAVLAERRK